MRLACFFPAVALGALGLAVGQNLPWAAPASASGLVLDSADLAAARRAEADRFRAIDAGLRYRSGVIEIGEGLATLRLPEGARYLGPEDADKVFSQMWGDVPGRVSLGMIVPRGGELPGPSPWGLTLTFKPLGHVQVDGPPVLDPVALMEVILEQEEERNIDRVGANNPPVLIRGWVVEPAYDSARRTVHYALEISHASSPQPYLDYTGYVLGKNGVLRLASMTGIHLRKEVQEGTPPLLAAIEFNPGHRHSDHVPGQGRTARLGVAGLIAGSEAADRSGLLGWALLALGAGKKYLFAGFALLSAWWFAWSRKRKPAERKEVREEIRRYGD